MPFGLKLRRTRRYNVLSKNCFVTRIRLLDSNVIECTLSVESTGQECLEAVAQRLELREVRVCVCGGCASENSPRGPPTCARPLPCLSASAWCSEEPCYISRGSVLPPSVERSKNTSRASTGRRPPFCFHRRQGLGGVGNERLSSPFSVCKRVERAAGVASRLPVKARTLM